MTKKDLSRRLFLQTTGKAGLAASLTGTVVTALAGVKSIRENKYAPDPVPYTQIPLPYGYGALEPYIDAQTMEIHYTKHAATYAKNLAEAVAAEKVDSTTTSLEMLLGSISKYSMKMRNNAGGHYNHSLFWQLMNSPGKMGTPSSALSETIQNSFGSSDNMKSKFNDAAKNRFGSGWAWVILKTDGKLDIASTANQDNPLMDVSEIKGQPLIGLDVWEHAYYLKYQNKRPDYINAWWNVLNWDFVNNRYARLTT